MCILFVSATHFGLEPIKATSANRLGALDSNSIDLNVVLTWHVKREFLYSWSKSKYDSKVESEKVLESFEIVFKFTKCCVAAIGSSKMCFSYESIGYIRK